MMERTIDEKDTMRLLLTGISGEKYCDLFREYGITLSTLPLLTEEDLIVIGIQEPELRTNILKHGQTKQLNCKDQYLPIRKDYLSNVLTNSKNHMLKLEKSLLASFLQIKLVKNLPDPLIEPNLYSSQATTKGISCLEQNIQELEKQINEIKSKLKSS